MCGGAFSKELMNVSQAFIHVPQILKEITFKKSTRRLRVFEVHSFFQDLEEAGQLLSILYRSLSKIHISNVVKTLMKSEGINSPHLFLSPKRSRFTNLKFSQMTPVLLKGALNRQLTLSLKSKDQLATTLMIQVFIDYSNDSNTHED